MSYLFCLSSCHIFVFTFFASRSGLHKPRRFPPLDDNEGGEVARNRDRQHAAGGANDDFDFYDDDDDDDDEDDVGDEGKMPGSV